MLEAVILGIIQGITEFLPVSSSGHLVLVQSLLPGFAEPELLFDIALHAGTLVAVLLYFRRDLTALLKGVFRKAGPDPLFSEKESWIMIAGIVVATIPAGIAGVLFEDKVEKLFDSPRDAAVCLIATGIILICGEWFGKKRSSGNEPQDGLHILQWVIVGVAQAVALLPGISRSGTTITAGLVLGWRRTSAARFSFLLMIPVVAGAVVLKAPELLTQTQTGNTHIGSVLVGTIFAALSGYFAIHWLLKIIRQSSLSYFGIYCICIGLLSFAMISA